LYRVHQGFRSQGLVEQHVQAGAVTGQQVVRGSFAGHGNRGNAGARTDPALAPGWGLEQFKAKTVGQLQIEQHQVVVAFSQKGSGPVQAVGFFDHTARPGVLKNHTSAQPVYRVIVDHEQAWC